MKNLLAIDTSGAVCTVGLSFDGNRFALSEHVEKKHNERLLPMLSALTEAADLSRDELISNLHAVAFGRGPGSFTGVRIAAAAAQAIALAAGARVLRVSSSELLAEHAIGEQPSSPGVLTSIRSRRDLHYLAAWINADGVPAILLPDGLHGSAPDPLFHERFDGWPLVGEAPQWWRGRVPSPQQPDGDDLLRVALRCLARGEEVDPEQGLPEYLSGDSPWRKVST